MPKTSLQEASNIAEALRNQIAKKIVQINDKSISVTSGFGLTSGLCLEENPSAFIELLMHQADKALYHAKKKRKKLY